MAVMKLVESANEWSPRPLYEFRDFEKFREKQEKPVILHLTYRKDYSEPTRKFNSEKRNIKDIVLEEFQNNTNRYLGKSLYLGKSFYGNPSEKLNKMIERNKKDLNKLEFANYYNTLLPINKKSLPKIAFGGLISLLNPGFALSLIITGIGFLEYARKTIKKGRKRRIDYLEEYKQNYKAFKSNIDNATIITSFPNKIQEIKGYKEITTDESIHPNSDKIEQINKGLREIYKEI